MKYKQRVRSSFAFTLLVILRFPVNLSLNVCVCAFVWNESYDELLPLRMTLHKHFHKIVISNEIDIWWTFWLFNNVTRTINSLERYESRWHTLPKLSKFALIYIILLALVRLMATLFALASPPKQRYCVRNVSKNTFFSPFCKKFVGWKTCASFTCLYDIWHPVTYWLTKLFLFWSFASCNVMRISL